MKKSIKFLIIILIIIFFIWFKFIRIHLPKNIPFNLNFITLLLSLFCIIILSFSLFSYFFKNKNKFMQKKIIDELTSINIINSKNIFITYFFRNIKFLTDNLSKIVLLELFIRLILCISFFIDVVIFKQISYVYLLVYLYIYIYLIKICYIILKIFVSTIQKNTDEQIQISVGNFYNQIKAQDLIQMQVNFLTRNEKIIEFNSILKYDYVDKIFKENALNKKNEKLTAKSIKEPILDKLNAAIAITYFISLYDSIKNNIFIKYIYCFITFCYLCLWSSILIWNINHLNNNIFDVFDVTHFIFYDPFSLVPLN